jgi:hypothetical protein
MAFMLLRSLSLSPPFFFLLLVVSLRILMYTVGIPVYPVTEFLTQKVLQLLFLLKKTSRLSSAMRRRLSSAMLQSWVEQSASAGTQLLLSSLGRLQRFPLCYIAYLTAGQLPSLCLLFFSCRTR